MGLGDWICLWMSVVLIVMAIFLYVIIKFKLPKWLVYIPLTSIGLVVVVFVGFFTIAAFVLA
ncbi:MAG: hypothetical protein KAS32_13260 [Candidatus Peribacteraceae bacterium]|nr:hypothetical protein [Candidatus Peribacteraceae bacterium]